LRAGQLIGRYILFCHDRLYGCERFWA
jgi:hypothetical protein